jgi:bifunctional N-acetylglucosamine-1-phosphate-uridyltransferase/glucosamine-1-phosphate-acetyltransferase GlmU-like protein
MASRVMIVPAAGSGSGLGVTMPKLLVPVLGRAMIEHLFQRYAPYVDRFILVITPVMDSSVRPLCEASGYSVEIAFQGPATSTLEAILVPQERVRTIQPDGVWITWCDQVAISKATARALDRATGGSPVPPLVFPTVVRSDPSVHFDRAQGGQIHAVRRRQEGDRMPPAGEGDAGLYALSTATYLDLLTAFVHETRRVGQGGPGEFLPFIPWCAARHDVRTFPVGHLMEAIGIDTPTELGQVEAYLRASA